MLYIFFSFLDPFDSLFSSTLLLAVHSSLLVAARPVAIACARCTHRRRRRRTRRREPIFRRSCTRFTRSHCLTSLNSFSKHPNPVTSSYPTHSSLPRRSRRRRPRSSALIFLFPLPSSFPLVAIALPHPPSSYISPNFITYCLFSCHFSSHHPPLPPLCRFSSS